MLNSINNFIIPFWIDNPGAASTLEIVVLSIIFGFISLLGLGILAYNKLKIGDYPPKNKVFKPAGTGLIYFGLGGFLFTLFRWLGADFLGLRIFPLLVFIGFLLWFSYFGFVYITRTPKETLQYETKLIKKKYLSSGK